MAKSKRNMQGGGKKGASMEGGPWRTPGSAETGALGEETVGPSEYARRKGKPHGKKSK